MHVCIVCNVKIVSIVNIVFIKVCKVCKVCKVGKAGKVVFSAATVQLEIYVSRVSFSSVCGLPYHHIFGGLPNISDFQGKWRSPGPNVARVENDWTLVGYKWNRTILGTTDSETCNSIYTNCKHVFRSLQVLTQKTGFFATQMVESFRWLKVDDFRQWLKMDTPDMGCTSIM